jgi:hypothetical protein
MKVAFPLALSVWNHVQCRRLMGFQSIKKSVGVMPLGLIMEANGILNVLLVAEYVLIVWE